MTSFDIPDVLNKLRQKFPRKIKVWPGVGPEVKFLLLRCCLRTHRKQRTISTLGDIEAVLDKVWEDLHSVHWHKVRDETRGAYSLASYVKVLLILQNHIEGTMPAEECLKKAIEAADMGLILGSSLRTELQEAATVLTASLYQDFKMENSRLPVELDDELSWSFPGLKGELVSSLQCPSLEYFNAHHFKLHLPAKLKGCIGHWPALERWRDLSYLIRSAGPRKVPVEIGSSYMDEDWGQKMITIQDFIMEHIVKENETTGYLAQHQLFKQIPELQNDIKVPEYCCLSEKDDDCEPDINAWFGPRGTVSNLHFDPKHNLLAQVIGRKRIILFRPEDSGHLCPHDSKMLFNTSQVDPYSPNYEDFPDFKKAPAYECHLYPGEMLYIPPKWWHHVRSLDTSFSVSFWWE